MEVTRWAIAVTEQVDSRNASQGRANREKTMPRPTELPCRGRLSRLMNEQIVPSIAVL